MGQNRRGSTLAALAACGLLAACGSSADPLTDRDPFADPDSGVFMVPDATPPNAQWLPLEPNAQYAGRTLSAWATEWARWSYAQTTCESAVFDDDGSRCGLYQQHDDVFILATSENRAERTRCEVPAGRAILVPLGTVIWDNAGVAPAKHLTAAQLEATVAAVKAGMRDLVLRVDGVEIAGLEAYGVGPSEFAYELPPEPNWYSCSKRFNVSVTGRVEPAYVGGFYALFEPPEPGQHTLEYGSTLSYNGRDIVSFVKTTITVK